jgi:hypothetical protein
MANHFPRRTDEVHHRRILSRFLTSAVALSACSAGITVGQASAQARTLPNGRSQGQGNTVADSRAESSGNSASGAIFVSATNETLAYAPLPRRPDGTKPKLVCRFYMGVGPSSSPFYTDASGEVRHVNQPVTPVKGSVYQLICQDENGVETHRGEVAYNPGDPGAMLTGSEGDLARALSQARTTLTAPAPALVSAPPLTDRQIVGVKTWFWLADWHPLPAATATAAGYTVTLSAVPARLVIDPGDGGRPLECTPDNAPAWKPTSEGGPADTGCGHTYHQRSAEQPGGVFTVNATVSYDVVWQATDPTGAPFDGGTLDPPLTPTGTFPITVHQIQAVGRG